MSNVTKAILFDFDGVLVNTTGIWFEINKVHNPNLDLETYKEMSAGNYHVRAEQARESGSFVFHPEGEQKYEEQLTQQKVEEDLKNVISSLKSDHKLFIVSSGSEKIIGKYLREQNIFDDFTEVLGHEFHHSKEEKIKHILKTHQIEPHLAVMITDTSGDIQEAKLAKVKSIGVLWGLHDNDMLALVQPDRIVTFPSELNQAIQELLQ